MLHRIILGHLLGDGHIAKVNKGNSYFCTHRKADHHSLNEWTKKQMLINDVGVSGTYPKLRMSGGRSFPSSFMRTARSPFWSEMREVWYKDGEKKVPIEYVKEHMSELSLALWFADDGDKQGRISTDSFSKEDVMFLKKTVEDILKVRLNVYHQHKREDHLVLKIPKSGMRTVKGWYRQHVNVPELLYKFN